MSRIIGADSEAAAVKFLKKQGCKIIEQNRAFKFGEADIVCWDGDILVFVEVKYRKSADFGAPENFVTYKKQKSYFKMAGIYSQRREYRGKNIRFDIVSICGKEITRLKNAFWER